MSVLEQVYAEGGDLILSVFDFRCDAWEGPIVLVQDFVAHTLTTELEEEISAQPCAITWARPKRDASGTQNIKIAFDGVRPEAARRFREAAAASAQINVTVRLYLESDKSEPAEPPYHLIVRSHSASMERVEVTAGLFDLIDMRWPREVYNSNNAPCLKFYQ